MTALATQPETLIANKLAWPQPGIHLGVDADTYHGLEAFSKSGMDKLRRSPLHYLDYISKTEDDTTDAQLIGRAVHTASLEPEKFDREFAVGPDVHGNTKEYKAFKKDAEANNQTPLNAVNGRWVQAISGRVRSNPVVKKVLGQDCWIESSLVCDRCKYVCKARPDIAVPKHRLIADLKTTGDGSKAGFAKEIAKYHYHTQAAWYMDTMSLLTGDMWDVFWFIAAEKKRPFCVSIHEIKRDSVAYEAGKAEYEKMFELYVRCSKTGIWPGYGDDVFTVELPDWADPQQQELDEEPFD